MPANREGVLRVSFDPDKQFFEQNRQLRSLVTRELFKRSFQNCPALSEEFGAAFLTSDRQMMSNGSSITRWLSSDQVVRFKAVHKPHCPGMGYGKNTREMIDRESWFMADQGQSLFSQNF